MPVTIISNPVGTNVPVGSVIQWDKSLPGVPALPSGWMECDGSLITDVRSPMVGQNVRNLNSTHLFIRGSTTSGTTATPTHNHIGSVGGGSTCSGGSLNLVASTVEPPYCDMVFIERIF